MCGELPHWLRMPRNSLAAQAPSAPSSLALAIVAIALTAAAAGSGAWASAATAGELPGELLRALRIDTFAAVLQDRGIYTASDLQGLTSKDMRAMGVKLGSAPSQSDWLAVLERTNTHARLLENSRDSTLPDSANAATHPHRPRNLVLHWQRAQPSVRGERSHPCGRGCGTMPLNSSGMISHTTVRLSLRAVPVSVAAAAGTSSAASTQRFAEALRINNGHKLALEIWRAHHDSIDVALLLTERACAVQQEQCGTSLRTLFDSMVHQESSVREPAWQLFTAMLPRLHREKIDLDSELWHRNGTALSKMMGMSSELSFAATGVRMTPLAMAAFTSHVPAVKFLARNGLCSAVRDARQRPAWAVRKVWHPLMLLVYMHAFVLPDILSSCVLAPQSDGFLRKNGSFEHLIVACTKHSDNLAHGPEGYLPKLGIHFFSTAAWRDLLSNMEQDAADRHSSSADANGRRRVTASERLACVLQRACCIEH